MKGFNKFYLLSLFLVLFSCKKEDKIFDNSQIRDRYFQLEKIGWKSKVYNQYVDDINFTATEVPIQYYLLKDKGNEDLFLIDSLYEQNKTERVIEFTYHQDKEENLIDNKFTGMSVEDTVKYMSFSLDNDFYVVTSKNDTIACSGVNYERTFKITPNQKILLFFSGIDPNEKIQLVYKDYLFKKGLLKFKFKDPYIQIAL
jgi:hypothetical protein